MALIKYIETGSFFEKSGEQQITIVDLDSTKQGLTKKASDSRIDAFVKTLSPDPGRVYLHILALSAGEFFGANRNADWFPEEQLIKYHDTFVTSPAHIFRNHINKNPAIAIGQVIFSVYNERMHRVELVAWLDKEKGADIVERLEQGEFPATSMACKTPFDVCSICGNKAHTTQEYCTHLANDLGRLYPDGRKVMALNLAPLRFFDQSIVVRPADVTSSVLQKVASADGVSIGPVLGSAFAAMQEGLTEEPLYKSADINKLSEFIKEVGGEIAGVVSPNAVEDVILNDVQDPHFHTIQHLKHFELSDILHTFSELGISPSLRFLAELVAQKEYGEHMTGAGDLVSSLVEQTPLSSLDLNTGLKDGSYSPFVHRILLDGLPQTSLLPEHVEKRAYIGSNVGYIGNGPMVEPREYESFRNRVEPHRDTEGGFMKMLQTLLTIGGIALASKWYITKTIEQKMKEKELNSNNSHVKITLVKSASDYKLTHKLAKAAMVNVVKNLNRT